MVSVQDCVVVAEIDPVAVCEVRLEEGECFSYGTGPPEFSTSWKDGYRESTLALLKCLGCAIGAAVVHDDNPDFLVYFLFFKRVEELEGELDSVVDGDDGVDCHVVAASARRWTSRAAIRVATRTGFSQIHFSLAWVGDR